MRRLTFDDVDLDWLDFYAGFFEPENGVGDVFAQAFHFEGHDPGVATDGGLPDIGDEVELVDQFIDDGLSDQVAGEIEPEAFFFRRFFVVSIFSHKVNEVLASRDGGHDADFVAIFNWGGIFFEKTDVFVVDVNIDEAAHFTGLVADAILDTGISAFEMIEQGVDGGAFCLNEFLVAGKLAKWGGDADVNGHG